jgi:hypothetical protein
VDNNVIVFQTHSVYIADQLQFFMTKLQKRYQLSAFKKSSLDYRAMDISFRRAATQILESLSNAPLALYRGVEQGEKATVIRESVLWGCPGLNFKANLPFNGMMQFFTAFLKEISMALFSLFSNR